MLDKTDIGFNNSYFLRTSNPFVDGGIYAIQAYYKKDFSLLTPIELKLKIGELVDLYLSKGWKKNMPSIFTVNSKFSNPSIKDKRLASLKYLEELLNKFSPPQSSGTCIACGRRDAHPIRKRNEIPLTGSGKLVNYFAGASGGE